MANKDGNAVNDALKMKLGDAFENDLTALMEADDAESGDPIIIALADVDHFDHINKDFGHEAGDKILIAVGEYIKKSAKENGAEAYRVGGDQFAFLFHTETTKEDVFLLMNEIKNKLNVKEPDGSRLTISIGIAEAFEDANRVAELVRKADGAMFRVKLNGRDKVGLAREEKMVPKTSHYTQAQLQSLTKLSKREGVGEAILLREALDMLLKKYRV